MCVRNNIPDEPVSLDSNGTLIDQLIVLSEVRPMNRITVTGHHTLDVFLGLCRRGLLNASCCTQRKVRIRPRIQPTRSGLSKRNMPRNCARSSQNAAETYAKTEPWLCHWTVQPLRSALRCSAPCLHGVDLRRFGK
jgi:hypothetical protein